MPTTVAEARDQMSQVLKDAIDESDDYEDTLILWKDTDADPPNSTKEPWIRFAVHHSSGRQASLSGALGTKRYRRNGIVRVRLFTAKGEGHSTSDVLGPIIMHAYEAGDTPDGVWFRNVRIQEVGVSGGWFETDILADFEYDEIH